MSPDQQRIIAKIAATVAVINKELQAEKEPSVYYVSDALQILELLNKRLKKTLEK